MPSLTSIFLTGNLVDPDGLIQFFQIYGRQLLTLGMGVERTAGGGSTTSKSSLLDQILLFCPNLRELLPSKILGPVGGLLYEQRQYPSIKLLGVCMSNRRLNKADWEKQYALELFPNLITIRLIDVLDTQSGANSVIDEIPSGLVVEDALGNVINRASR